VLALYLGVEGVPGPAGLVGVGVILVRITAAPQTTGDNYNGPVDHGDKFNGPIHNSTVGGRNNTNTVNNKSEINVPDTGTNDMPSMQESQLVAQLLEARKKLEAKRAKQRADKLKAELAAALAELGDDA